MHFDVVYNPFDVKCKFRIGSPKYLFLWCLILAVKWIKKRVSGNDWKLLPWDSYRVRQTNHLYTIHFKSMFLFKKHPPFQRHFLTSILTPDVSYTFPKISEVPLYHATDFTSKPLMFISKSEELCDQNVSQLFFRVRCLGVFFVLWDSAKVTKTSIVESIYTLILWAWNHPALCFSCESA